MRRARITVGGMLGVTEFVLGEMELKVVLDSVLESARRLTGAR